MSIESFYYPKFSTLPDAWKQSSFSEIAELWILSHSQLSPSAANICKIADRGSIQASIIASQIDLKEWVIAEKSTQKNLTYIGMKLFMPPLGCIWHASHGMYYFVQWIRTGERHPYFNKHIRALVADLIYTIATLSLAIATGLCAVSFSCKLLKMKEFAFRPDDSFKSYFVVLCASLLGTLFFPTVLLSFLREMTFCTHESAISKSYFLKQHLGLIGENGWLLTYDQKVDHQWLFDLLEALRRQVAKKVLAKVEKMGKTHIFAGLIPYRITPHSYIRLSVGGKLSFIPACEEASKKCYLVEAPLKIIGIEIDGSNKIKLGKRLSCKNPKLIFQMSDERLWNSYYVKELKELKGCLDMYDEISRIQSQLTSLTLTNFLLPETPAEKFKNVLQRWCVSEKIEETTIHIFEKKILQAKEGSNPFIVLDVQVYTTSTANEALRACLRSYFKKKSELSDKCNQYKKQEKQLMKSLRSTSNVLRAALEYSEYVCRNDLIHTDIFKECT